MFQKTQEEITKNWEGNEPVVSICCITYNHEKYIEEALDSFLMQETDFPFEILIHDDASTDNTANIIKAYEKKYPDLFRPIYQTENQKSKYKSGMNPRFNYPRARGKYIALCDGDDYWTDPKKLQKQVEFMEGNEDYGLVFTDVDVLTQKTGKCIKSYDKTFGVKVPTGNVLENLIEDNPYKTCTSLFRRDIVNAYLQNKIMHQPSFRAGDILLWLYFSDKTKIGYIPESTTVRRLLENSASQFKAMDGDVKFRKNMYKMSLYHFQKYAIPFKKKKLKQKYVQILLTKAITKNNYRFALRYWKNLDILVFVLFKEKVLRPLLYEIKHFTQ